MHKLQAMDTLSVSHTHIHTHTHTDVCTYTQKEIKIGKEKLKPVLTFKNLKNDKHPINSSHYSLKLHEEMRLSKCKLQPQGLQSQLEMHHT